MPRKGENIYRRKDGRWEGRYIKDRTINNKAVYGYVYGKSYSETRKKLLKAKTDCTHNTDSRNFSYWLIMWLQCKEKVIKKSSYIKYKNNIDMHIMPHLGNMTVNSISTSVVQNFVLDKLNNGKIHSKSGLSSKTVMDLLTIIKNTLNYSKSFGEINSCDFKQITIKKNYQEMRILSIDEERRLNKVLLNNQDIFKLGVLICLYTGIRIGELCALKWENISLTEKYIKIEKTMQRLQLPDGNKKTKVIITEPKSLSSMRIIPLPDFLIKEIKKYQKDDIEFVISTINQNFTEPRTMQNHFKRYTLEAGIDNANFHCLRHTFATRCVEKNFEIKSLSVILGHSSVKMTLDKYVHVSMQMKRENMSKVKLAM